MSKQHIININGATQGLSESVSPTRGSGQRIRLVEPAALDLVDADTGMGPTQVQVKRVGSALNIALDGNSVETPDFVVENFFEKEGSTLMGQAQPGEYCDYITTESEDNKMGLVGQMWDGSSSPLIFGEASPPTAFALAPLASPYLFMGPMAVGALTVGALTSSKGSSATVIAATPTTLVPTILINSIAGDNAVNNAESQTGIQVAVTGQVGGDAKAGDQVILSVNGTTVGSGFVASDLSYSINVAGIDLKNLGSMLMASISTDGTNDQHGRDRQHHQCERNH